MPAFAVLAGYLYALTPVAEINVFLLAKARRLLLPMLVVGTLFAVMQSLAPGSNLDLNRAAIDWTMLHIVPVNHFWFIEAIFLIFVVVAVLDQWLRRGLMFIAALVIAIVIYPTIAPPPFWGSTARSICCPIFCAGLAMLASGSSIRGLLWRPFRCSSLPMPMPAPGSLAMCLIRSEIPSSH